jgi:hypothetical protein
MSRSQKNIGGSCSTYWGAAEVHTGFGGETRGKRPIGRPRRRIEDNIKMDHSGDQITEEDGAGDTYGGQRRCIQGLLGRPEGNRPLEKPRRRLEDNIKMDL